MTRTPTIRTAVPADASEIARLCAELGYPAAPGEIADRLHTLLKSDDHLVAVAGGDGSALLGWVAAECRHLLVSGARAEIVGLIVDRSCRKAGIGAALVQAVENWTARHGVAAVFVRSNVTREDSHRFYESIGFERSKTQHAYTKALTSA